MLTPHQPSENLHPPRRASVARPEDLADVHITEYPSKRAAAPKVGQAITSGRSASINTRFPNAER